MVRNAQHGLPDAVRLEGEQAGFILDAAELFPQNDPEVKEVTEIGLLRLLTITLTFECKRHDL